MLIILATQLNEYRLNKPNKVLKGSIVQTLMWRKITENDTKKYICEDRKWIMIT